MVTFAAKEVAAVVQPVPGGGVVGAPPAPRALTCSASAAFAGTVAVNWPALATV